MLLKESAIFANSSCPLISSGTNSLPRSWIKPTIFLLIRVTGFCIFLFRINAMIKTIRTDVTIIITIIYLNLVLTVLTASLKDTSAPAIQNVSFSSPEVSEDLFFFTGT